MSKKPQQKQVKVKVPEIVNKEIPIKLFYFFIIAFTFLIYANSLSNNYAIDDIYVTNVDKTDLHKSSIKEIFTTNYATVIESGEEMNFGYRPIVKLSFVLDQAIFGQNPHLSHLVNLLLYILIVVLLFYILKRVFKEFNIWIPFLIVLIYSAHPINTEVVCSLKNRDELLSLLFSLLSLILFIQYSDDNRWWKIPIAFLLFAIALFSKISSLTFIIIIPLVLYYYKDIKTYKLLVLIVLLLVLAILIQILPRLYLEPSFRPKFYYENPLYFNYNHFFLRWATGFYILLYYIKLVLLPHPLLFYYGYKMIEIVSWSNPLVWLSLIIHLTLFIYAILNVRKKTIISFAILYYLVTISMFANILRPPTGIIADRFLLRSLLGFCIILVIVIFKLYKVQATKNDAKFNLLKSKAIIPFFIILTLYSVKTISRTADWKDTMTLVGHDIKYLENSAKANFIYAGSLRTEAYEKIKKSGNLQNNLPKIYLAIDYWNKAIKVYPDYYDAYNMLGETYFIFLKDKDKAIEYFKKAIKIKPDFALAYYNLGFIARNQKQYDSAEWYLKQSVKYSPGYKPFYLFLADMYRETGNEEEAQKYIKLSKEAKKFKKVKRRRKHRTVQ
jgi:protein O-mannosyl-transferase